MAHTVPSYTGGAVSVPSMEEFNALVARVIALEAEVWPSALSEQQAKPAAVAGVGAHPRSVADGLVAQVAGAAGTPATVIDSVG